MLARRKTFPQPLAGILHLWEGAGTKAIQFGVSLKARPTAIATGEPLNLVKQAVLLNWLWFLEGLYFLTLKNSDYGFLICTQSLSSWLVILPFIHSFIQGSISDLLCGGTTHLPVLQHIQHTACSLSKLTTPLPSSSLPWPVIFSLAPHQTLGEKPNDDSRKERGIPS